MTSRQRTQVAIVGGGPAGSLLAHLLHLEGIACVVLEHRSREHVLSRIRAGVLEAGTVATLREAGLGQRLDREGYAHDGTYLAFGGRQLRIDFAALTGRRVTIYGQTEVQHDLYDALATRDDAIRFGVADVALHDVTSDRPSVTYTLGGEAHHLEADHVVGCDGYHGPSRAAIPDRLLKTYERTYPFGWLGILAETAPVADELIYANHDRGFALCSMRHERLSRYYVQVPDGDRTEAWSDERFWDELATRLPEHVAADLETGPSIEKSIAPLRSFVAEPMRHGNLFLAGDAAHIVPPTGAKGLNLAVSDVVYLARALADRYATGSTTGLDSYSATALRRVWKAVRFSWWMTTLLHRFPDADPFDVQVQRAELELLEDLEAARADLAHNYVGLPI